MIFSGCKKDFLEVSPKGKLIASNTEDYDLALNTRSLFSVSSIGSAMDAVANAALGDEIVSLEPYFTSSSLRFQRLFRFEDNIYNADQNSMELDESMQHLYIYNKIINEVMSSQGGSEEKRRAIRAEALIGRAWTYFYLISYYAKQYNEATASTDPGFSIVRENDLTASNFTRNTVQEVYDFIFEDLRLALEDAPDMNHRLRASKLAGEGLFAKVYIYMGKYDLALPHLNNVLNNLSASNIPVRLINYADLEYDPMFAYDFPRLPDNSEIIYGKQVSNAFFALNNEILIPESVYSLYSSSDLRKNNYMTSTIFGDPFPIGFYRKVSPGTFQMGVVLPELVLLRAECFARLGHITDAVADLETLRSTRIEDTEEVKVPAIAKTTKEDLVRYIFDERIREFATEGHRWHDMRRIANDPIFANKTYVHHVYNEDGTLKESFTMNPNRLTLKIPAKILLQNPGMVDNP